MTILGAGWRQRDSWPAAASLARGSRIPCDSLTYTEWGGIHMCVARCLYLKFPSRRTSMLPVVHVPAMELELSSSFRTEPEHCTI